MRRMICALGVAVSLTAAAGAITYGTPDGDAHPNVGLLAARIGNSLFAVCSGTLVAPDVFLTAAHCTEAIEEANAQAYVVFTPGPTYSFADFVSGTPHTHPDWNESFPNRADIGVVVLDTPVFTITPARIPTEGFLDDLSTRRGLNDVYFTHVGYGAQSIRPITVLVPQRYQGVSSLVNLVNAWTDGFNLQTTANPGKGRSGVCFGDSGGPAFYENTDIVVGIHSFARNQNCMGTAYSYRVDIATSLDFLAGFGVTP